MPTTTTTIMSNIAGYMDHVCYKLQKEKISFT